MKKCDNCSEEFSADESRLIECEYDSFPAYWLCVWCYDALGSDPDFYP